MAFLRKAFGGGGGGGKSSNGASKADGAKRTLPPGVVIDREEEVLVLYGSQRGAAEKQAKLIAEQMSKQLSNDSILDLAGCPSDRRKDVKIAAKPACMDFFDFVVERECRWARLNVIVLSSYGTGGAPTNAKKFRSLCDKLVAEHGGGGKAKADFLKGMRFALLGLGDSFYKTYMQNPKVTEEALLAVGATPLVERGVADANDENDEGLQQKAMDEWTERLWKPLAEALLYEEPLSEEQLAEMARKTVEAG